MINFRTLPKVLYIGVLTIMVAIVGCQDLSIDNENDPDRRRSLTTPEDISNIISTSWLKYWNMTHQNYASAAPMPQFGDEATNTFSSYMFGQEPRQSFPNNDATGFGLAELPWFEFHAGMANTVDGLKAIELDGIIIPEIEEIADQELSPETTTEMVRAFGWFNHGLLYSYIGLIYDQSSLVDVNTDLVSSEDLEFKPYTEIAAFAINSLNKAIDAAENAEPFQTPESWMGGISLDNEGLAKLANSYIARLMVYMPRNPEERAQVDWEKVIDHIDNGITEDFSPVMSTASTFYSFYMNVTQAGFIIAHKADYKLIGPADVSGNYEEWMDTPLRDRGAILITSPDRRITGTDSLGNLDPETDGSIFRYAPDVANNATTEQYLFSYYQWFGDGGVWNSGEKAIISVKEMNLLKAEAHLRKNNPQPSLAADIINITRVNNGQLPAITGNGIPESADCVPRTQDGAECGTIYDALHHERMIELIGMDAWRAWFDRRGFGTLAPRTFEQIPVSYRELEALGMDIYTYGGQFTFSADDNINVE